jgi:hypothetical protein
MSKDDVAEGEGIWVPLSSLPAPITGNRNCTSNSYTILIRLEINISHNCML